MPANAAADRVSYQAWQAVEAVVSSPLDRTGPYWRYVISAYPYFRSRLYVPGRAYDSDEHGMLAIGGSAHCDVMSLDVYLVGQSKEVQDDAIKMMDESSAEQTSYWRGMGRGNAASRRQKQVVDDIAADLDDAA